MENLRKADCCWNCKHALTTIDYDEPYTTRCCLTAGKAKHPRAPSEQDGRYCTDKARWDEYYRLEEEWGKARPEVPYGDICDSFCRITSKLAQSG